MREYILVVEYSQKEDPTVKGIDIFKHVDIPNAGSPADQFDSFIAKLNIADNKYNFKLLERKRIELIETTEQELAKYWHRLTILFNQSTGTKTLFFIFSIPLDIATN